LWFTKEQRKYSGTNYSVSIVGVSTDSARGKEILYSWA